MGLINQFINRIVALRGQPVILRTFTISTDNQDGVPEESAPIDYPINVVVAEYSQEARAIAGEILNPNDLRVFVFASPIPIDNGLNKRLVINNLRHEIISVIKRGIAAPVLIYELQVRRDNV